MITHDINPDPNGEVEEDESEDEEVNETALEMDGLGEIMVKMALEDDPNDEDWIPPMAKEVKAWE
ncbi:hypothetical protein H0H87_011871, partial [Tephrocybe sp. NHM501043]